MNTIDKGQYIRDVLADFANRMSEELLLLYIAKIALYEIVDPSLHFKKVFPELQGKLDRLEEIIGKNDTDEPDAKETIDFIRRESVNDFSSFYKPYSILVWTHLETFIKNLVVAWIKNNPQSLEIPIVKSSYEKLKDYNDEDEKYHLLVDILEVKGRSPNSFGVNKFENLLRFFSLNGEIDKDTQNALLELQQVRNLLVHRRGVVDKKLLDVCDWVVSYGEKVFIDDEIFEWYVNSTYKYAVVVADRVMTKINSGQ